MTAQDESLAVVILAAGQGTRMKSSRAKVLHELCGRSMLGHVVGFCVTCLAGLAGLMLRLYPTMVALSPMACNLTVLQSAMSMKSLPVVKM